MDSQSLWFGAIALVIGIPALIWPRRSRLKAEAKWEARRGQIDAGDSERYFEERRSLDAYPPLPSDRKVRLFGAFMTACGAILIALAFAR